MMMFWGSLAKLPSAMASIALLGSSSLTVEFGSSSFRIRKCGANVPV